MKKIALILLACVLLFNIAACSSSSTPPASNPPSGNTESPTSESPTKTPDVDPPADPVTVSYWAMWNENETQALVFKEAIKRYEAATGNTVEVNWAGRDVRTNLKTAIDAGQKIDVIENSPDWFALTLGTDYLLNMDQYMDMKYASTGDQTLAQTLIPSLIDLARTYAGDGSVYYIPQQPSLAAMFYNKDVFDQAGVTSIPNTWDEFMAACEKIKATGVYPMTVDDAYYSLLYSQYLMQMKGDKWTEDLVFDTTGELWADPALLQMAQAMAEMRDKGYFSPATGAQVFPSGQNEVATGITAMYFNGSWYPNEVAGTTGPDFNWGIMAFPNVPNATEPNTKYGFISQGFGISPKSENPEAAAELIAFLLAEQTQQDLADQAVCIPATNGVEWPKTLAAAKLMFDNMTGAFAWSGNINNNPEIGPFFHEQFGKLLSGSIEPEQFVSEMQAYAKG